MAGDSLGVFLWYHEPMAKPLVVGNWKSFVTTHKEGKKLFKAIEKGLPRDLKAEVVVCPPSLLIHPLASAYSGKRIAFGVQDIFFEHGAHTGETSALLARDVGARFGIAGHAERRGLGESDAIVAKEVGALLDARLTPIVAFGEKTRDREGNYLRTLEESILNSLALVDARSLKKVILAYEPVWAIGAALPPSSRTIRESIIFIRKVLATKFDRADALKVRILYGGAVSKDTAPELISESGADGFLLGRASIDPEVFTTIIRLYS